MRKQLHQPLKKEVLPLPQKNEYGFICRGTEHVNNDSYSSNHTWHCFMIYLVLVIVIVFTFTVTYFGVNDSCSRQFFSEQSTLNKEDIIEPELDPCDDFYSFACGRWNHSERDNVESVIEETEIRNLLRVECFLKHSSYKTLNPWSKFVKKTYDLCEMEKYTSIDNSKTVAFVKTVAAPLIFNKYNQSGIDYVLNRVHHKFLQNGLFSWDVALDLKHKKIVQAVRITTPKNTGDGLTFTSKENLVEYMKEVLSLLGAEKESLQSKCEEVVDFMILQGDQNLRFKARQKLISRKLVTYEEFIKKFDFIRFNEYFQGLLLPESVHVVIEEARYFKWLGKHIKRTEKGSTVIQNLLYWSLIDSFVPYMPKAFGEARDKYANKLDGKLERRVCLNAVRKEMNFAVSSFFMDKVFDDKSRDMVNDIALHVKNSFRDSLYSLQNPNRRSGKWLNGLEKVLKNIEIGIPTHLRSIYENNLPFVPSDDSFPSYLISGAKFVKEKMLSYIHNVPLAFLFLFDFLKFNGIFIRIPKLVMNIGIFTPPIFHSRQPLSLNYAGLGFVLSHELAHSIDYIDETSSVINLTLKLACLQGQYNHGLLAPLVLREDFADNIGIKIAYKAYLEHVSRHYELEKITLKERKMFFLHFSQIFCEKGASFTTGTNALHSPYKHRINVPLSNFPDFSETFKCPKGSRMNKENKCSI